MKRNIVTFGEIMMRLSPPGYQRLRQACSLDVVYGGAEANVAIALANFGLAVQYVTRLPENELGISCLQAIRQHGVGSDFIAWGGDRLGLYFLESGTGNRPSQVIYDREQSAFAAMDETAFAWETVLAGACWFHWSGISPAVSRAASQVTGRAVEAARKAGVIVSCDLNYRHSLWRWGATPSSTMPDLVSQCDVLAANAAHLMLGIPGLPAGNTPEEAAEACAKLAIAFPNLKQIAMTCRDEVPAGVQRLTGVLWQAGRSFVSPSFPLTNVVDRVGAGDAFMAGLIYGLIACPDDPQRVIDLAVASAAIKHSIVGDANLVGIEEIERLLGSQARFDIIR